MAVEQTALHEHLPHALAGALRLRRRVFQHLLGDLAQAHEKHAEAILRQVAANAGDVAVAQQHHALRRAALQDDAASLTVLPEVVHQAQQRHRADVAA